MKPLFAALLVLFADAAGAEEMPMQGGVIDLQFTSTPAAEFHAVSRAWVTTSGRAIARYFGKFPVHYAVLRITPRAGREPKGGQAFGWNGPLITISLGRDATTADLADDWLLVHEMIHLGFPDVDDRHHWLEEGLATYVEPIARARAGLLTPNRAWSDLVDGLPQGQPEKGDGGLDVTHTWGRTYWGGALFCLRADVEIRRRTGNHLGLEHALRAIVAAGGTIGEHWEIDRVIATGDHATGTPVLRQLYDEMKSTPTRVDLDALWKQLGILRQGDGISFEDSAPLAPIRKAITGG